MRSPSKSLLILPLAAALMVGCSDSEDSPANETSAPGPNAGENPTVLTKFDGTYLESCEANDPDDATQGSEVIQFTLSGDTGTERIFNYSDADCTVPDTPAEIIVDLSIAYPGGSVETTLGTADFVNVTGESVTVDGQPPTAAQQEALNSAGAYNTIYDILLLDGSSLYAGDDSGELDGESAETRPNTLDSDPAIRQ